MALPGMRGYGRDDNWAGGRNSGYRARTSNQDYGPGAGIVGSNRTQGGPQVTTASPDPLLGRRIDSIEQKMGQQDNTNRGVMEQLLKIQQDFKIELKKHEQMINEEKSQRMRLETAVQGAAMKLGDLDDRMRKVEDSTKENKSALTQLIMHTKNIERAVSLSQQDMQDKGGQQASKLQELLMKVSQVQQNKEVMDRTVYNIRDEVRNIDAKMESVQMEVEDFKGAVKMQSALMEKLQSTRSSAPADAQQEGKMTETQRAMLEAKIMQCQQSVLDIAAKVSAEKRERDHDFDQVNSRMTSILADFADKDRKREADRAEHEAKAKEQASLGNAEKQNIIMQISAVQTEIKRTLDERDTVLKSMTVNKLEEMDTKLADTNRARAQLERDLKDLLEAEIQKEKLTTEGSVDTVRKMMESENEKTRIKIQELKDNLNHIEEGVLAVKSSLLDEVSRVENDGEAREKVLDAKIEDLSDKLRFGMATMQAAIGENRGEGGEGGLPMEEVEKLQEEAIEGVRESVAKQITDLEDEINSMRQDIRKQNELIDGSLRGQKQDRDEANNILGDSLHQKMDSIAFTQERMKRQVDDLQQKISGAPSDMGDLRDRIEDIERNLSKKSSSLTETRAVVGSVGAGGGGGEGVGEVKRDLDKILGRDSSGTEEIDGIPTLPSLQNKLDTMDSRVRNLSNEVETLRDDVETKLKEEKDTREEESESLRKDLDRLDKKTKEIKERIKGKLGISIPDHILDDDEDNE